MSGSYPDIAADWTQMLPNHDDVDGYETSGTSFATPRTAGILSFVLEHLRTEVGDYGSGASSEERGGMLVNGMWPDGHPSAPGDASISNAMVRHCSTFPLGILHSPHGTQRRVPCPSRPLPRVRRSGGVW